MLYPNKIIVSNKLLGLLGLGLELGFESGFILYARNDNSNKLLELLNVVTNNLIGIQRADRLFKYMPCTVMGSARLNDYKEC